MKHRCLVVIALVAAQSVSAAPAPFTPVPASASASAMVRDHRHLIDDHARWNAEHLAAARRLEAVAAALRAHATSFDRYGEALRLHERRFLTDGYTAEQRASHARLQIAHEAARRAHDRVMRDVADLEQSMAADFAGKGFTPY